MNIYIQVKYNWCKVISEHQTDSIEKLQSRFSIKKKASLFALPCFSRTREIFTSEFFMHNLLN